MPASLRAASGSEGTAALRAQHPAGGTGGGFSLPGLKLPSPWEAGIRGLGSNGRRELRALILGRKSPLGPAPGSQQLWGTPGRCQLRPLPWVPLDQGCGTMEFDSPTVPSK